MLPLVDESFEGAPVAVDVDAPKLSDGLNALSNPSHAAMVASLGEDELDGALDDVGGEDEVATPKAAVSDLVEALGEVAAGVGQAFAFGLVARTLLRKELEASVELGEDGLRVVIEQKLLLLGDPLLGGLASIWEEGAGRGPDLLEDVIGVDGVLGVRQVLGAEAGEVVVTIGHELDEASAVGTEPALDRLATRNLERAVKTRVVSTRR
ncbi:MAG: hypothetical protein KF901_05850 [Myxococcales bacterium]|nr:hypothetical protein [Myxococcales bacterium]